MTRADVMRLSDEGYRWLRDEELPRLRALVAYVNRPDTFGATLAPVRRIPRYVMTAGRRAYFARRRGELRQTHCKCGHPLSGDNLRAAPRRGGRSDRRVCRTCYDANQRRHQLILKAVRLEQRLERFRREQAA